MIGSIEATSTPIVSQSISRQPSHLYTSRHDVGWPEPLGGKGGASGFEWTSTVSWRCALHISALFALRRHAVVHPRGSVPGVSPGNP
jgi:hypothetical protein